MSSVTKHGCTLGVSVLVDPDALVDVFALVPGWLLVDVEEPDVVGCDVGALDEPSWLDVEFEAVAVLPAERLPLAELLVFESPLEFADSDELSDALALIGINEASRPLAYIAD